MDRAGVEQLHALLEELERARAAITAAVIPIDDGAPHRGGADHVVPELDEIAAMLARARTVMLRNPAGANAVVRWLVGEGQRFASTPEGAEWRDRLHASPELEHVRELWEAVSVGVFDRQDDTGQIPVAWIDLVHDLITSGAASDRVVDALRPPGLA